MQSRPIMKNRVLNYLQENGSITTWEAIQQLGCTRLSEYIRQLKKEYNIVSVIEKNTNRYGEKVSYSRYILKEN